MKNKLVQKRLFVKGSPVHGYGVFAEENIQPEEIIEECHSILTDQTDPLFNNYYFGAGDQIAIILGFGCIYNHSNNPNAHYIFDKETNLVVFRARRFIAAGEEIFVYYGDDWFSSRNIPLKEISLSRKILRYVKGVPLRACAVAFSIFSLIYLGKFLIELSA